MAAPLKIIGFVIFILGLSSCAPEPKEVGNKRYTSSIVSVSDPGFHLKKGDKFAWFGPVEIIAKPDKSLSAQTVYHLKSRFEQDIRANGLLVVGSQSDADYLLDAVIILDHMLSKEELVARFDIAPSLIGNSNFDEGTLVLRLLRSDSRRTLWRGAMEVFSDPNESDAEHRQRIDHAVDAFSIHFAAQ